MIHCPSCNKELSREIKFCSSCGAEIPQMQSSRPVSHPMSARAKKMYSIVSVVLLGVFLYLFIEHLPGKPNPVIEQQPSVAMSTMYTDVVLEQKPIEARNENGKIVFSLNLLLEKKIIAFEYQTPNLSIPLLAFINADGKLVTCVRLCEPCNSRKFRIVGDKLACGNCETEWKQNNLEGLQGSCQKYPPLPIPSVLVGSEIQIDEQVLKNWKMRI